ncbi:MAG: outer membrane beta-barrel protein [Verrucomicrobiota bacterium]
MNKWTYGLAAVGLVTLGSVAQAEEKAVPLTTALSQTILSGYVDVGANYTIGSGNNNPVPVSFNGVSKQDGFNVNVVNLTLEKPLDENNWSAGYKAELLFGPDAVAYNTSINSAPFNDFSIKQAYVALRAPIGNGLDLKVGSFDTIVGYESFVGYRNPNITRSYGYTIEPTEHTGVLASYQICDAVGISAGIANTLAPFINNRNFSANSESRKTYMASVTLTAPESFGALAGSALYAGIVDGFNGNAKDDQTSYYIGGTLATPVTGLKIGASYDQVSSGGSGLGGYASALALYASFQATEKLSLHSRAEYAKGAIGNSFAAGGTYGKIFALTGTIQYDLWQNVISRLEVRWDHSASGADEFGGRGPGTAPTKKNSIGLYANLVYVF